MLTLNQREVFVKDFFAGENDYRWESITSGDPEDREIWPWIQRLLADPPLPTVLPYAKGGKTVWYAIAPSSHELRRLAADIMAFLGPTWTDFRGVPHPLDPKNPIDAQIAVATDGQAFRFHGMPTTLGHNALVASLNRMRRVWEREVKVEASLPRSTERLLRDFQLALAAGNRLEAEQTLQSLKQEQRLGVQNLLFLRVRMLYEFGRYRELLALGEWDELLANRRPLAVTEAMVTAVYAVHLAPLEKEADPKSLLTKYQDELRPRFSALAAYVGNSICPEMHKLRMLEALSVPNPSRQALEALINSAPDPTTRQLLENLVAVLPVPQIESVLEKVIHQTDPVQQAREALDNGDFDQAFQLALALEPSERKVRILAECAEEFSTLEAENAFLNAFEAVAEDIQEKLLRSRKMANLVDRLTTVSDNSAMHQLPEDWCQWLEAVIADPSWPHALDVADRGSREWELALLATQPSRIKDLVTGLQTALSEPVKQIILGALPALIRSLLADTECPRTAFSELYGATLDLLVFEESVPAAERSLFLSLTEAMLVLGVPRATYAYILDYGREMWDRHRSHSTIDWIFAFLELLVYYPSPDQEACRAFVGELLPDIRKYSGRFDEHQYNALDRILEDCQLSELIADWARPKLEEAPGDATPDWSRLAGKKVLFHSVQEVIIRRAADVLQQYCPKAEIVIATDHAGNPTFKSRIREADLIVMLTWHSKHAATGFIEQNIHSYTTLLRPDGKGTSAILRSLASHCRPLPHG